MWNLQRPAGRLWQAVVHRIGGDCFHQLSPAAQLMLRAHSGVAECLIIEITESAATHDIDETKGFVARVKDLGCRIAIDDSAPATPRSAICASLASTSLRSTFVQNMIRSEDDRAFVRTLIDLSKRLKLLTVAEWVQDERTAKLLEAWGCDYLQGALIGLALVEPPWRAGITKAM